MKKTIAGLAVLALIPALFAVFSPGKGAGVPSGLRDAVADNSAIGQIGYSGEGQVQAPPAPAAPQGWAAASAGASFTKGSEVPVFSPGPRSKSTAAQQPSLAKLAADNGLSGKPPYEVLAGLFEKGAPALEKDLAGWHAGRTLLAKDQNKFLASLVAMRRRPINAGGGPLFENEFVIEVVSKMNYEKAPEHFDAMNAEAVKAMQAELSETKGLTMTFPEAVAVQSDAYGSAKLEYRKMGAYVFERWSTQETGKEWKIGSYAYFFKDVTPR